MSFQLPTKRAPSVARTRWSGAAFLVEAMLLLVFVAASLALFVQLFAASADRAAASRELTDAIAVATATAERFCADPVGVEGEFTEGDMLVVCRVEPQKRTYGTMYYATISVYPADSAPAKAQPASDEQPAPTAEPVYTVQTAKYESGA